MAAPRPRPEPVTRATLPSRRVVEFWVMVGLGGVVGEVAGFGEGRKDVYDIERKDTWVTQNEYESGILVLALVDCSARRFI